MKLETAQLPDGVSLIKLTGDLDLAGVGEVETMFYAHCGGEKPRLLVDLSGTGFIASLGIRLLLQAIKTVSARGGRLVLFNPTKPVGSAIDISGLGQYVLHGSEADAATLLQSGK